MRIRSIKPEFYKHDGLASLSPLTRILFTGLWCMADSAGRLEDRAKRIKAEVLPYDDCDIENMLSDLAKGGFIERYEVKTERFIAVCAFRRHQRITGREAEAESRFPAPTGSKVATPRKRRGNNGETPGQQPESLEGKGDGREGKGDDADAALFPASLDTPEFRQQWDRYIAYRKSNGMKTLKTESVESKLAELATFGPDIGIAAIQRTISNGWTGIFPDREKPSRPHGQNGRDQSRLGPTPVDAAAAEFFANIKE
jgi:hypothetical protein